jgi:hypothetical protein
VNSPEAPDEIDGVDADHGTVAEELSQRAQGDAVIRIIEGGNEYGGIGNIEIGLAGREALAVEVKWRGRG